MAKTNIWMSVSDLMTGLMIIFLFIAISYMSMVKNDLSEYADTKRVLYDSLQHITDRAQPGTLEMDSDLTMRFLNAETLFDGGQSEPNDEFKARLSAVMPTYLDIIMNMDASIQKNIKEIRVEGHSDPTGFKDKTKDSYRENLKLSQDRARAVLFYIFDLAKAAQYTEEQMQMLEHVFTANGYSYSRALDTNGNYIYDSRDSASIDLKKSRRVEIKIITNEKAVIEKMIKESKEQ